MSSGAEAAAFLPLDGATSRLCLFVDRGLFFPGGTGPTIGGEVRDGDAPFMFACWSTEFRLIDDRLLVGKGICDNRLSADAEDGGLSTMLLRVEDDKGVICCEDHLYPQQGPSIFRTRLTPETVTWLCRNFTKRHSNFSLERCASLYLTSRHGIQQKARRTQRWTQGQSGRRKHSQRT